MPSRTPRGTQPALGLMPPYFNQGLFSDHHLEHRLQATAPWTAWTQERCGAIHGQLKASLETYEKTRLPKNEEDTRQWLDKVLTILGAEYHREARVNTGRPDYVLFQDAKHKEDAASAWKAHQPAAYYPKALTVLEAKYWERPLQGSADAKDRENPVMQINRYLDDVAIHSGNAIQWAILTNGRHWRLYWRGATSRALTHYEVDLPELLAEPHQEPGDFARLRYFLAFFGPQAFVRDEQGRCDLDRIREASEAYAVEVGASLERAIYGEEGAFLTLAKGLFLDATAGGQKALEDTPVQDLRALEGATLVLLYRLLFLLYAEDRRLLPMDRDEYRQASLTTLRDLAAGAVDQGKVPTTRRASHWGHLETLFDLVNEGDSAMGLPYYNGGLFDHERHPLLKTLKVPDAQLLPALDALSRVVVQEQKLRVDFRDLGVRQLGSLYEGLLEYRLHLEGDALSVSQDSLERRTTASYYTHESLVERLVADTLNPILQGREQTVQEALEAWIEAQALPGKTEGERATRKRTLDDLSSRIESLFFDLRVVDPAMGSGHFLVAALDHLTDGLMAILGDHESDARMREIPHPVLLALEAQRNALSESLADQGLKADAIDDILPHLDDLRLLKRMVMKRCLFGVDLNPMAVELAKLSLWLDSFTLGAPLSFLDHHLKAGNSLVGAKLEDYRALRRNPQGGIQGSLYAEDEAFDPEQVVAELHQLVALSDASRDQVKQSRALHTKVEQELATGRTLLDIAASRDFSNRPRKVGAGKKAVIVDDAAQLLADTRAVDRLAKLIRAGSEKVDSFSEALRLPALNVLEDRVRHAFFHWELAFPEVFLGEGEKGFDAVIANPPWEKVPIMEAEFFGQHRPPIAQLQTAAERKRAIAALETEDPDLWRLFLEAKRSRDEFLDYSRNSGRFPLTGRGITNFYALMVERGISLLKPDGRAGFVVPSGLSTDHGNAAFFGAMVQDRRLAFLSDFENKQGLFPSVDSRFKFSLIGFTGPGGGTTRIPAAFFLHDVTELAERRMEVDPADFALVNPNTKTCPVFRTARDYALTKRIYAHVPVLLRHEPEANAWGIRFRQGLFNMTSDSGLFKTASQLTEMGAYPVQGAMPTWKQGQNIYLPLIEGKMVQAWDPRAAGVRVNLANIHRSAVAAPSTLAQWQDPAYFPEPQFWVAKSEVDERLPQGAAGWWIAFKDVTSPTNFRTMIAGPVPDAGFGNNLPILSSSATELRKLCLLANLNGIPYDFIARQKVGGQHLNFYIVEQLPTLPPDFYNAKLHGRTWESLIVPRALELSYTCEALRPLAAACGFTGEPYAWDPARRRHLQAQLDALFFLAYGFGQPADEDEVAYILSTFPILCSEDPGYASLVRNYLRAYRGGDFDSMVGE